MNRQILKHFYEWFDSYHRSFVFDDSEDQFNISLKVEHTYRVIDAIREITNTLDFEMPQKMLAESMALFHDTGRFKQYLDYGTFKDSAGRNHAQIGVEELEKEGVLNLLPDDERLLVIKVILNHNVPELPENMRGTEDLFSRLLRDADKVDIFRVVTEYYDRKDKKENKTIQLGLADEAKISDSVFSEFMEGRIIEMKDLNYLNDFKLLQIAWIHDLNFLKTFEIVFRKGYVEKILHTLPEGFKKEQIKKHVSGFFKQARINKS